MKFRNIKTGAVVEVESELGGDWKPVEAPVSEPKEVEAPAKAPAKRKGTAKK